MPESPAQELEARVTSAPRRVTERMATAEELLALKKIQEAEQAVKHAAAEKLAAEKLLSEQTAEKVSEKSSDKISAKNLEKTDVANAEEKTESAAPSEPLVTNLAPFDDSVLDEIESLAHAEANKNETRNEGLFELAVILDQHKMWVESSGEEGAKADLGGMNLENADLMGVNLQGAFMQKVNLRGADLSMANLRGASLVQADLRETNLLGTELRGANLMGATLYGAEGLWVGRLGGTNLYDATLPESIASFDGAKAVEQAARSAKWFYMILVTLSAICAVMIALTSDVRLVLNGTALPLPKIGTAIPMNGFYLGAPILLLCLYARFHFVLLRLWGNMAALPAVFRDGQTLEREGPWYLMGLIRRHFKWLGDSRAPIQRFEGHVATLLAYWSVPATLFFFWLRYLPRQDTRGTLLHILVFGLSVAAATYLPTLVLNIVRPGELRRASDTDKKLLPALLSSCKLAMILSGVLLIFSMGILHGLPAETNAAPESSAFHPLRWASQVLRLAGYRPYADLTEATLVTKETRRDPNEDPTALQLGAGLNQAQLHYARAYRASLPAGRLWRANLEGAYLTEADLRDANLREAKLHDAVLDHARAEKAVLISANGNYANLTGADLRGADFTYSVFNEASFDQAKLMGASLYGASLQHTKWLRADLTRADVRDTQAQQSSFSLANLELADFSGAKLGKSEFAGAQMKGTIFLGADLRGADLRGGNFSGAVLREAFLDGADLRGADFRGALGLTPAQVCSSTSWFGAQFDADVLALVQAQCPK